MPLGDVSPFVSSWPPALAHDVAAPRVGEHRVRRAADAEDDEHARAALDAPLRGADVVLDLGRERVGGAGAAEDLADRARLAPDGGDARRIGLVDLHAEPAHRGRAALPRLAREHDARVVGRELLHVGAERMGERDDRHAAQRREVLVGAAEGLPDHDGTDAEAGDGGGREGSQRGDAGSGLRGSGEGEAQSQGERRRGGSCGRLGYPKSCVRVRFRPPGRNWTMTLRRSVLVARSRCSRPLRAPPPPRLRAPRSSSRPPASAR